MKNTTNHSELPKKRKKAWRKEIDSSELEVGHIVSLGYKYYTIKKVEDTCFYVETYPLCNIFYEAPLIKIIKPAENIGIVDFTARTFVSVYELKHFDIIRNSNIFYDVSWIKFAWSKSSVCVFAGNGKQLIFKELDKTENQFELLYNGS